MKKISLHLIWVIICIVLVLYGLMFSRAQYDWYSSVSIGHVIMSARCMAEKAADEGKYQLYELENGTGDEYANIDLPRIEYQVLATFFFSDPYAELFVETYNNHMLHLIKQKEEIAAEVE